MRELFDAIFTRWDAEMAARVLYNTEAIEEATFPYSVVSIITDNPDWTFTEDFEDVLIQFNLFSDDPVCTEIGATFAALKAAFDKYDLVISDGTTISLERGPANLIRTEGVWQLNVSYKIKIEV